MNSLQTTTPSELANSVVSNTKNSLSNVGLTAKPPNPIEQVGNNMSGKLSSMESNINEQFSSSNSQGSWFGLSTMQIVIIIIILAFLGFNIFRYMDVILSKLIEIVGPLFSSIGIDLAGATKNIINDTATGTKAGVDIAAGVADSTVSVLSGTTNNNNDDDSDNGDIDDNGDNDYNDSAIDTDDNTVSNKPSKNKNSNNDKLNNAINRINNASNEPAVAPDSSDSAQQGRSVAKNPGYCFIGAERGIRTCVNVNDSSECDSGDMFASMQECVQGGRPVSSQRLKELAAVEPHNKEIIHPSEIMQHIESDIHDAI